jgi:murein L,D-transpeptidase YafK
MSSKENLSYPFPLTHNSILPRSIRVTVFTLLVLMIPVFGLAYEQAGRHRDLRIVILKSRQVLQLFRNGLKVKDYRICLGSNPFGPKMVLGDGKTPEGEYYICSKNTASNFHRFLGISYPGEKDAQAAFEQGMISKNVRDSIVGNIRNGQPPPWNTKLGGWVGIHGYPSEPYKKLWIALFYPKPHNWTDGCVAMWNYEIEDLFSTTSVGTRITILP